MGDLGGCFLGCVWFVGWIALEISMVVFTARHLGWFWAVLLGLLGIALPYAATSRSSSTPKSGPPAGPRA